MDGRMHRRGIAALAAAAALVGLLAVPGTPAEAGSPSSPYFTTITGPEVTQTSDANAIVGNFTDLVLDDILWYSIGSGKETLWTPCPECESGPFTKRQLPLANQVSAYYQPVVGDFAGNGLDDIYWLSYEGADYLWTNIGGGTFTSKRFDMAAGVFYPTVLPDSRSGDGKDDIIWEGDGGLAASRLWVFPDDGSGVARTKARFRLPLGQRLIGDFDGNGAADILFYPHQTSCRCPTPSAAFATDTLWRRAGSEAPGFTQTTMNIKGEYDPLVGRFSGEGDGRDDILWVGRLQQYAGSQDQPDSLWEGRASGSFTASSQSFPSVGGGFLLERDGADTALILGGEDDINIWYDTPGGPVLRPVGMDLPMIDIPFVGRFTSADRADIFFNTYGNGSDTIYHPVS